MTCKLCGGKTIFDTRRHRDEHEALVLEYVEKMKDIPCAELVRIITRTSMSFIYAAGERILSERGHEAPAQTKGETVIFEEVKKE